MALGRRMMHPSANLVTRAETFAAVCICTATRMLHGCPRHAPSDTGSPQSHHAMLIRIIEQQGEIMSALTDLQAADAALKAEVATFLADVATALSADDPDIEAVVSDINAQVAALQSADPATPAAPAAPAAPVSGGDTGAAS